MTKKIFWDDPYLTRLTTTVVSAEGNWVTLDATIFYALSGGQESDSGTIGELPVLEAKKSGMDIAYRLCDGHGLQPGRPVEVKIEWERRFQLMRLHFAAELALVLVTRELAGVNKIGAHISIDRARIDFQWNENITPVLARISSQMEHIISQDLPIISAFDDVALQRRYWEIAGFAREACGGTHLKRTGEVGAVSLKRKNVGKGKERIMVTASPASI